MTLTDRWIDLDGAANARDVGGLPTADGGAIRPGRLIRSDNLQLLSPADVRLLVDDLQVRTVIDLRAEVEVDAEGPGPMTREPGVRIEALSLFPRETNVTTGGLLPWQSRDESLTADERRAGASAVYLRYLDQRPDSILTALRLIAGTDGAALVHCAAGKDRTGVVVAFALSEVGVTREAIIADYALSAERIEAIFDRLRTREIYSQDDSMTVDNHRPRAETMVNLLAAVDEVHGGVSAWLRANGWTDADAAALRRRLLD